MIFSDRTPAAANPMAAVDSSAIRPALNGAAHGGTSSAAAVAADEAPLEYTVERRQDGSLVVRVPPRRRASPPLPDAVFAFRLGDPQYAKWLARYESQSGPPSP